MLRIGLLGASRIAPRAIIGPASRRADVVISAVAARDGDRARVYAKAQGIPLALSSYEELVTRDDLDLIYCALPPAAHHELCVMALQAGKAVLVEKPFALNAQTAQIIVDAASRAGRPAMEAFHYRFHSMFLQALHIMKTGCLGRLRSADGRFNALIPRTPGELRWIAEMGGGGTMDLGCYVIHALRTLVGEEPDLNSARAVLQDDVDATMDAELRFGSGAAARVQCSMLGGHENDLVVEGEAGILRLQSFVSPQNGGRLYLTTSRGDLHYSAEGPGSYDAQLAHVVEVVRGDAAPLTGGADAVANMALIDQIRTSVAMRIA